VGAISSQSIYVSNLLEEKKEGPFCKLDSTELSGVIVFIKPISPDTPFTTIYDLFMEDETLSVLPVVDSSFHPLGLIKRKVFFEKVVLGKYGYGMHLNMKKRAFDIMENHLITLETHHSLEEIALKLYEAESLQEEIVLTENKKYVGILFVKDLLLKLSQKIAQVAQDLNPLTKLPGNWAIRQEVNRRLKKGDPFEVIYIDLNDFKPYNDAYGFEKGDLVIQVLGELLKETSKEFENIFIGHIGGDDFVVITRNNEGEAFSNKLIKAFERKLSLFHTPDDLKQGFYESVDRRGELRRFPLLSMVCAIIPSSNFSSFSELSAKAAEVKAYAKTLAKSQGKSVYFKDRRSKSS